MAKNRITKIEATRRTGYILLGLFAFMIVEPLRLLIAEQLGINGWSGAIVGVVGFIVVLYYFEF